MTPFALMIIIINEKWINRPARGELMKRWLLISLMFVYTAVLFLPSSVLAYSYGDANTEDVAETFKLVQTSIGNGGTDWNTADEAYKVRRAEIAAHFGEEVASTLDSNFQAKDSKAVITNFKAVLVMNLDRRFNYATQGIDDYAQAKLLLAKAKATFDTLKPYIGSGSSDLEKAFDDALDSLGNPGLFGVGKKPVQPAVFKEKASFILGKVKPLFPYTAAKAPTPTPKPAEAPKPETPVKTEATPKPEQPLQAKPEPSTPSPTAKPAEVKAPDAPAATAEKKDSEPTATPASSTPSPTPEAAKPVAAVESPKPSAAQSPTPSGADSKTSQALAHAPMQRTDKTNSLVSVSVIGAVIIIFGGGLWLARRKNWI